jgi:chemotaxis protein MotA
MDKATILGLLIGLGGILLGNYIEGGHVASLVQSTAFLIVISGTFGAVLVSNRTRDLKTGFQLFRESFGDFEVDFDTPINEILECAKIAKKDTVLALEKKVAGLKTEFLKPMIRNIVDSVDVGLIREISETQIDKEEERLMNASKIWSDAGGYSPTIGIIGAVLGLIHVMGNLSDTSKLGAGIAVAFVATVYGVGFANLIFLPIASKIKKNISIRIRQKQMILEGALMIGAGVHSTLIEQKLIAYRKTK